MRLIIPSSHKKDRSLNGVYLCTVDREHRHKHQVPGTDVTLILPKYLSNDHKEKHPNIGTIVQAEGDVDFTSGDIIVKHFTFEKENGEPKTFYEKDGVEYFRVLNKDVMFKIDGDNLIPRRGILLCEAVKDKLYDTTLEVEEDYRRDICKVLKVWEGCTLYKPGDYLLLNKGGDYVFTHNGKEYLKVDHYFNDVNAIVDSTEYRYTKVTKRVRNHNKENHMAL